jgi:hypothetical protein
MKKHPWFTGTTISHPALVTELTRRKGDVDAAKQREKSEKKKRADEAAAAASAAAGALSAEIMRGEAITVRGDDMPIGPPSMWSRAAPETAMMNGNGDMDNLSSLGGLGGELGGSSLSSDMKIERSSAAPAQYDPTSSVACYTSFESSATPLQLIQRIGRALDRFHGTGYSCEDDKYKVTLLLHPPLVK